MIPTLLVGDWLFVNKLVYGPHIPFTSSRIPGYKDPQRLDIVVFKSPTQTDQPWDPNPTLTGIRNTAQSLTFPNFAATGTFGTAFSLDGVHPSAEGQKLIANNLITVVNSKYGTTLKAIP